MSSRFLMDFHRFPIDVPWISSRISYGFPMDFLWVSLKEVIWIPYGLPLDFLIIPNSGNVEISPKAISIEEPWENRPPNVFPDGSPRGALIHFNGLVSRVRNLVPAGDSLRIFNGFPINVLWIVYGFLYGFPISSLWLSYGFPIDFLRVCYGCPIGLL